MQSTIEIPFAAALPTVDCPRPYRALSNIPVHELHYQLQDCERRLGTPEERPDDFECARHLAHEINNRVMVQYLQAQLRTSESPLPLLPRFGLQQLVA